MGFRLRRILLRVCVRLARRASEIAPFAWRRSLIDLQQRFRGGFDVELDRGARAGCAGLSGHRRCRTGQGDRTQQPAAASRSKSGDAGAPSGAR